MAAPGVPLFPAVPYAAVDVHQLACVSLSAGVRCDWLSARDAAVGIAPVKLTLSSRFPPKVSVSPKFVFVSVKPV